MTNITANESTIDAAGCTINGSYQGFGSETFWRQTDEYYNLSVQVTVPVLTVCQLLGAREIATAKAVCRSSYPWQMSNDLSTFCLKHT